MSADRTREHVEREYGEEKWPAIDRMVEATIAAERDPSLSRVLQQVLRSTYRGGPLGQGEAVFGGRRASVPTGVALGAVRQLLVDVVCDACTDATELVVELGSGPGWTIQSVWLGGGPADATYVGAEYTAAGRRAADRLASLAPGLKYRSLPFDYHQPDLSALGHVAEAVVFTAHSLEQIPNVNPELFSSIRALADKVTVLHFEPVGWQLDTPVGEGSSKEYADEHDYTRDLVARLREEEAAGRLAIDAIVPEVVGVNPSNSTTLVGWHAPAQAG